MSSLSDIILLSGVNWMLSLMKLRQNIKYELKKHRIFVCFIVYKNH